MLNQLTVEKLHALHLNGMADAYCRQMEDTSAASLSFEERFGLLVDHHWSWRENQAMARRLKKSKLDSEPCVEDIDYRHPRGLDRQLMRSLIGSQWVAQHLPVLLTGPTGIRKSWLAQALAQKACRDGYTVLYRPARSCSATWPWLEPTAVWAAGGERLRGPMCWWWMTLSWRRCRSRSAEIFWRSAMTAMAAVRPSSPASCQ